MFQGHISKRIKLYSHNDLTVIASTTEAVSSRLVDIVALFSRQTGLATLAVTFWQESSCRENAKEWVWLCSSKTSRVENKI